MHAHGHGAHGAHGDVFASDRFAERLEVEGELSAGVVDEAIAACAERFERAGVPVRRVVDLGCGPGVGSAQLAAAFASADLVAVDGSRAMLERAAARAARLGHGDRVETRQLDLDGDLGALGRFDLAWAAMAVHHAQDEVETLRRIGSLLEPDGLVCLLERADPTAVRLADDLGRPGIWDRLEAAGIAAFERVRETMPGAANAEAYPAMLAAAGLELLAERTLVSTARAAHDAATHQFLAGELERTARAWAQDADATDREALRAFVASTPASPQGRWEDATVTSSRKLLLARPTTG